MELSGPTDLAAHGTQRAIQIKLLDQSNEMNATMVEQLIDTIPDAPSVDRSASRGQQVRIIA